ncbi:MAG TPA: EB domain-containing protein [Polyangiaceae bacterium]
MRKWLTYVRVAACFRNNGNAIRAGLGVLLWASFGVPACSIQPPPGQDETFGRGTGGAGGETAAAGAGGMMTPLPEVPAGLGIGQDCSEGECRAGLVCEADVCEPAGNVEDGEPCVVSVECADDLQCVDGVCTPAGDGEEGDACGGDADCERGLRCAIVGLSAQCAREGEGDVGTPCGTSRDCLSGLACLALAGDDPVCSVGPRGLPNFGGVWPGVDCEPIDDDAPVRAYFEVPGAEDALEGDFFRLPFPNDVRIDGGEIDLDGFPTPGTAPLGVDPVRLYVDAVTESESGWGAYPTVLFRFSGQIDFESFRDDEFETVRFVDVTPGAEELGDSAGFRWFTFTGRGRYVCQHWFGVRRPTGAPLLPGHTYAIWLTTDGRAESGDAIERADNLVSVLDDEEPSDPALERAHEAFQPFRDFLDSEGINPNTVLNASVITVAEVRDPMRELADAIAAEDVPEASDWVRCEDGAESPCPDASGDRACGPENDDYDEYHALVTLPIFQEGDPPYRDEGGNVDTSGPVRSEQVCMALTVPKLGLPTEGWPLVVFAHGTGGSFRNHVVPEVAGALAQAEIDGTAVPFAVLGIDQVEHGPRRGDSTDSPENLFFNFLNPAAGRGNPLQGAADQLALARFAAALDVSAAESGGVAIAVNPEAIVFFGHSQGATEGSLMLPYSDVYKGAVLSGNGASLMDSLLTKTRPVDIASLIPFVLNDFDADRSLFMGDYHPVLSLVQQWIDPADPLNFAEPAGFSPQAGGTPKHIFQTYGLGDSFSTPETLVTYARAARLTEVGPHSSADEPDDLSLTQADAPVCGNGPNSVTLAVRQYGPPSGSDGHFVAFDVAGANQDVVRFLAAAALGQVPPAGPGSCD